MKESRIKPSSEKSFGNLFGFIFLLISLYPMLFGQPFKLWSLIVGFVLFFIANFTPRILIIPNLLWFRLGLFLGKIISPIIIFLVYIITVIPVGLLLKLLGKDILNIKQNDKLNSYWVLRTDKVNSMKDQY